MQKIFINKETDMIEQILKVETANELSDDYFDTCYAVIDNEDKINAYNLKYNKETKEYEVVEGLPPRDEGEIIKQPSAEDNNNLKQENEDLKDRVEKLEGLIDQVVLNVR